MANPTQVVSINFNEQTLQTVNQDGIIFTPIKHIAENIGLEWHAQFERIQRDDVLNSTIRVIRMVAEDGKERDMTCLPIEYLNGWLFGVSVNRVKKSVREFLTIYKKECYHVLNNYWNKGQTTKDNTPQQHIDAELVEPNVMYQANHHINQLKQQVEALGGVPVETELSHEQIITGFLTRLITDKHMLLSFGNGNNPNIEFISKESWVFNKNTIADTIKDKGCGISDETVKEIMMATAERLTR